MSSAVLTSTVGKLNSFWAISRTPSVQARIRGEIPLLLRPLMSEAILWSASKRRTMPRWLFLTA